MQATVIYNPLAGPADMHGPMRRVARFWKERGWSVDLRPTEYAGHAVELAQEAANAGHRLVVAAGGDGTMGEVANGLANTGTIMAPLPAGTGNSFGKELGMPHPNLIDHNALVKASAMLADGRVQRMDLGRFQGGKYWLLWTGAGLDSYIVQHVEPRSKLSKRLGPVGYAVQAIPLMPRFPPMAATVTVDGRTYTGDFLMVLLTNCRRYAGGEVLLNPWGKLDDGAFELFLFRGHGSLKALGYLWQVWRGEHEGNGQIERISARQVTLETERTIPVHTDGDPAGKTPFTCTIVPRALRLLVPQSAPAGLFTHPGAPL